MTLFEKMRLFLILLLYSYALLQFPETQILDGAKYSRILEDPVNLWKTAFKNLKGYGLLKETISVHFFLMLSSTNFTWSIIEYFVRDVVKDSFVKKIIFTKINFKNILTVLCLMVMKGHTYLNKQAARSCKFV